MLVYRNGKSDTVFGPSRISATPRYRARVPIVTASEGRPTRVTSRPLISPARIPASATTRKMASIGQCLAHRNPSRALDMPRIDATDRSISPLITISVMGSAMIAISPEVTPVLKKLPGVRNCGEDMPPKITMAMTSSARPLSQRSAAPAAGPSRSPHFGGLRWSGSNAGTPSAQCGLEPYGDHPVERDGHQQEEAGDGLQPQRGDTEHVQRRVDGGKQEGTHGRP